MIHGEEGEFNLHAWVKKESDEAIIGITKEAIEELGDIVHIELPVVGSRVCRGQEVVVLESTKAAIDSCSPVDGEVIAVNERVSSCPSLVSQDPEGDGWLYRVRMVAEKESD